MTLAAVALDDPTYCTDEDLAIEAGYDFGLVVPESQKVAAGNDGSAAVASPWVLASANIDFASYGVSAGHVAIVSPPDSSIPSAARAPLGKEEYFVVAEAPVLGSKQVTLRRVGQASGVGQPLAAPSVFKLAVTTSYADLKFLVATFSPQIALTTRRLRVWLRRLADDSSLIDRLDDEDIRHAAIAEVLASAFGNQIRRFTGGATAGPPDVQQHLMAQADRWRQMAAEAKDTIVGAVGVIVA